MNNPPKDRYFPKTGYKLGQRVLVDEGADFCHAGARSGRVVGFGNPEITDVQSVRVRFDDIKRQDRKKKGRKRQAYTYCVNWIVGSSRYFTPSVIDPRVQRVEDGL